MKSTALACLLALSLAHCNRTADEQPAAQGPGPQDTTTHQGGYVYTQQDFEQARQQYPMHQLQVPAGFRIELYAPKLDKARSLCLGANGTVFVSTRQDDKVYALVDEDNDGRADRRYIVASGLSVPNGIAFRDGALYIAQVNRILRIDGIESRLHDPPQPTVVFDKLPNRQSHGWKFIAFGPDGKLYVPIGALATSARKTPALLPPSTG